MPHNNPDQFIGQLLQEMLRGNQPPAQAPAPGILPETHNTRFQMLSLLEVINNLESFVKEIDRPSDENHEGPPAIVTAEEAAMAATAALSAATNRLAAILCDDRRWKRLDSLQQKPRAKTGPNPITQTMATPTMGEPKMARGTKPAKTVKTAKKPSQEAQMQERPAEAPKSPTNPSQPS